MDEDDDFGCVLCLHNIFHVENRLPDRERWLQCSEGHLFCEYCYVRIGGEFASCLVCKTKMGTIRNRIVEKLRLNHAFGTAGMIKGDVDSNDSRIFEDETLLTSKDPQTQICPRNRFKILHRHFYFWIGILFALVPPISIHIEQFGFWQGIGHEQRKQDAKACLNFLASTGLAPSVVEIRNYSEMACLDMVSKCRSAANLGHEEPQVWLANVLEQGMCGRPPDLCEAAYYLALAAEQGSPEAQHNLALYFSDGAGGLRADPRADAHYLRLAAGQGLREALRRLSAHYRMGAGAFGRDLAEAARIRRLARDPGRPARQEALRLKWRRRPRRAVG